MNIKNENPVAALSDEEVRVIPADYTLKKIIGEDVDLKQILSTENVEKAQQIITEHKDNFLDWVAKDLNTLEQSYRAAASDLSACGPSIKTLARAAFVIKSQAGTFGFDLATQVAKSLDDFCNQHFRPGAEHMTVIRKHIDALVLIFQKNITGDGDATGKELTENLFKLVEKYKKQGHPEL